MLACRSAHRGAVKIDEKGRREDRQRCSKAEPITRRDASEGAPPSW